MRVLRLHSEIIEKVTTVLGRTRLRKSKLSKKSAKKSCNSSQLNVNKQIPIVYIEYSIIRCYDGKNCCAL